MDFMNTTLQQIMDELENVISQNMSKAESVDMVMKTAIADVQGKQATIEAERDRLQKDAETAHRRLTAAQNAYRTAVLASDGEEKAKAAGQVRHEKQLLEEIRESLEALDGAAAECDPRLIVEVEKAVASNTAVCNMVKAMIDQAQQLLMEIKSKAEQLDSELKYKTPVYGSNTICRQYETLVLHQQDETTNDPPQII